MDKLGIYYTSYARKFKQGGAFNKLPHRSRELMGNNLDRVSLFILSEYLKQEKI